METLEKQMSLLDDDFGRMLVVQSNTLIEASYDLTVTEKKIFVACAAKINSRNKVNADTPFTFTIAEAKAVLGMTDNKRLWEEYEKACDGLMRKQFEVWNEKGNKKIKGVFAHTAKFNYDEKRFTLYFSTAIIPYLSELSQHFTKYRLLHIGRFSSKYAIRLYEYMVMMLNKSQVNARSDAVELEVLKGVFGIEEGQYDKYSNFKSRVLEPAVQQITENTDINADFEVEEKNGRKVSKIRLNYLFKNQWLNTEERLKNERYVLSDEQIEIIKTSPAFHRKYLKVFAENKAKEAGVTLKNEKQYIFEFLKFAEQKLRQDPSYFIDFRSYLGE